MTPTLIDEIPAIVKRTRAAFRSGRTRPMAWRIGQLRALKSLLKRNEDTVLDALREDLGKSPFEGWVSEVNLLIGEIDHTLDHVSTWARPERVATPLVLKPAQCKIYHEPLGVALIIGPWNYPLQLVLAPLIGALAAGNAAVLKPSEVSANVSRVVAELVARHLDAEAIAVVEGGVAETTRLLEQRFDHIFYTGNGHVGRIVMTAAARHLCPVTLELGGKSPCIVDSRVNMKVALRRIVWGKFFNAGQTCVAPDYVLCHRAVAREFTDGLARTIARFYGQDPKRSPDYARIINERHVDRLSALLGDGEILCGGQVDRDSRYIAPTVLRNVSPDSTVMTDEIFGPILPVLEVADVHEAIDFVNERDKPLALYLFSDDKRMRRDVIEGTSSGGGCMNDCVVHLGCPDLPFGGVGPSGMGAYHGRAGFETFSHRKSVLHKSTLVDPSLRYPPYNESKMKWARWLA